MTGGPERGPSPRPKGGAEGGGWPTPRHSQFTGPATCTCLQVHPHYWGRPPAPPGPLPCQHLLTPRSLSTSVDNMPTATTRPAYRTDTELHDLVMALVVQHQLDLFGKCDSSSLIDQLHDAAVIARAADESVRSLVKTCRKYNASWADIGGALGVSRQGAQQRFGES